MGFNSAFKGLNTHYIPPHVIPSYRSCLYEVGEARNGTRLQYRLV